MKSNATSAIRTADRFLVRWLALPLLRVYQKLLSPVLFALGSRCRFYPSCSSYSVEAFQRHGILRGFGLSVVRLAKCNPLHPGGFDPVPPAGHHHNHDHQHHHDHSGARTSECG